MNNSNFQFNLSSGEVNYCHYAQGSNENYYDRVEYLLEIVDEIIRQVVAGFSEKDQLTSVANGVINTMNHFRRELMDLKFLLQGPHPILWPEIKSEANLLISRVYRTTSSL